MLNEQVTMCVFLIKHVKIDFLAQTPSDPISSFLLVLNGTLFDFELKFNYYLAKPKCVKNQISKLKKYVYFLWDFT